MIIENLNKEINAGLAHVMLVGVVLPVMAARFDQWTGKGIPN